MPTFARRHLLTAVLAPLLDDPTVSEVVVVVDGCHDGSMALLESMAHRHRILRPMWRENGGEGHARQTGLESLSTDIALFLDDDVVPSPGLASGHLRYHAESTGSVVLGYMPVALDGTRRRGQAPTYLYAQEYERACASFEADAQLVLSRFWAGNFSLRTADALAVGMASEGFAGVYHADQDFGLRCAAAGLRGVFDRSLLATHLHHRSLAQFARDARAQGVGRVLLESRHPAHEVESTEDYLFSNLPKALLPVARNGVGLLGLSALSQAAIIVTGAAHRWEWELLSARLLRRSEQIRGAMATRRSLHAAAGPDLASASAGG